jgi:hypothetical protein
LTDEACLQTAEGILQAAEAEDIDPKLILAVQMHECDLREGVGAPIWLGTGRAKKQIGVDACPMGVRIIGVFDREKWSPSALYRKAAQKMATWQRWCARNHTGHHFISHYNPGNPVYSAQVLGFLAVLSGKPPKNEELLTARSKEIISRLLRVFRLRKS